MVRLLLEGWWECVAERMGIVPELLEAGYRLGELREIAADGRVLTSLDPDRMIDMGARYVTVARADLASAAYTALGGEVETIFGDTVHRLHDDGRRVHVEFAGGGPSEFDLVVGPDGLNSRVRRTVFGPDVEYERELGIVVAAFDVAGYRPRDELVAVSHAEVGFQVLRLALRDGATMFLFTLRHEGVPSPRMTRLHSRNCCGRVSRQPAVRSPRSSRACAAPRTFYFDRVSQIRMPSWSRGRVALIGDAAACPSLLAGQGSALAMVEAYELAAELRRSGGDHKAAYAGYERRLAPLVRRKQDAAVGLGVAFAPRSRAQLRLRNTLMRMMTVPLVSRLVMGRSLRDPIELSPPPTG